MIRGRFLAAAFQRCPEACVARGADPSPYQRGGSWHVLLQPCGAPVGLGGEDGADHVPQLTLWGCSPAVLLEPVLLALGEHMLHGRDDGGFFVREVFGQCRGHSAERGADGFGCFLRRGGAPGEEDW